MSSAATNRPAIAGIVGVLGAHTVARAQSPGTLAAAGVETASEPRGCPGMEHSAWPRALECRHNAPPARGCSCSTRRRRPIAARMEASVAGASGESKHSTAVGPALSVIAFGR